MASTSSCPRYGFPAVVILACAVSAAAEPVMTIRANGNSGNRVDLVILGDGYTSAELASGKYASDVELFVQQMFLQEPYQEYSRYFNVHRVDVTSVESGVDHPELGILRATALDAGYNCAGIQRLICVNVSKVNEVLSRTALADSQRDMILVIVNDTAYGGSGGSVAVASVNPSAVELILHELGHSFALLTDEYGGPAPPSCNNTVEPSAVNATAVTTRAAVKWAHWIEPTTPIPTTGTTPGVAGLFEGAAYCDFGLYRPTFNSKMRSLGRPFEQINTEQHIKRIYNLVDPLDDSSPAASSVAATAGQMLTFSVAVPQPQTHTLDVIWSLDGLPVATATPLAFTTNQLAVGSHLLTVTVRDATPFVRSDPLQLLQSSRTWTVQITGTSMTPDKSSLRFGALTSGASIVAQSSSNVVRLVQAGPGTVTWTASANQPWLTVDPASGTGPATLTIGIVPTPGLPSSGTVSGSVVFAFSGSGNASATVGVTLSLIPSGTSANPFGFVDTPLENSTGVTGAIPMTGWALDDIEVAGVTICRAAVTPEVAPVDGNCGGNAQIFVGSGVFIDGARPDVQAAYPTYPRNNAAGWGFMVLTNMLPNQGNGTFVFYIYARDRDGHVLLLGTRTMTCANAQATAPFGTIDTPGQGDTVSGSQYVNFGWALTQNPKVIPFDGSTLQVYVDGVAVGSPSYNHYRSDIATIFPGLANSDGAVGFKIIDTTTLANGLHTIVWTATDSAGLTSGLGSRFFRVSNGVSASPTAAARAAMTSTRSAATLASVPVDPSSIVARRSWDPEAPWRAYAVGRADRIVVRGEEIDRFAVDLGEYPGETYAGYVHVGEQLNPLPIGSRLDAQTGTFTWSAGVGFVGTYDLVFVRSAGERMLARREVRFILQPKGSGHVGSQVVIDTPRSQQDVAQPFLLGGWAADLDAAAGTGVDTLHVWAYPLSGAAPVFLGTAPCGGVRTDVAAIHGDQFRDSGYGLLIQGLTPGNYDLAVFAWSTVSGGFVPATTVRLTVR